MTLGAASWVCCIVFIRNILQIPTCIADRVRLNCLLFFLWLNDYPIFFSPLYNLNMLILPFDHS